MIQDIQDFIEAKLKNIKKSKIKAPVIKHEDRDHYLGVIAGKEAAYEAVLSEISRLRHHHYK